MIPKSAKSIETERGVLFRFDWQTCLPVLLGPLLFGSVEPWATAFLQAVILVPFLIGGLRNCPMDGTDLWIVTVLIYVACLGLFQALVVRPPAWPSLFVPVTADRWATLRSSMTWFAGAAFYLHARASFRESARANGAALTLAGCGLLVASVGIMQRASGDGTMLYWFRRAPPRSLPFGPYVNPDHGAAFLVMTFFAALGCFSVMERRDAEGGFARGNREAKTILRIFLLGFILFAVYRTGSRGAVVSACTAACAALFLAARRGWGWRWAYLAGPAVALVVLALVHPTMLRLGRAALVRGGSFRIGLYRDSLRMIAAHPFWGVGLGAAAESVTYYRSVAESATGWVQQLHSDWFQFVVEAGVPAAVLAVVAVVGSARELLISERMRPLEIAGAAGFLAYALHGTIESNSYSVGNALAALCCLALARSRANGDLVRIAPPRVLRGCLLAGVLVIPGRSFAAGLLRLSAAPKTGRDRVERLAECIRMDPVVEYRRDYLRAFGADSPAEALRVAVVELDSWGRAGLMRPDVRMLAVDILSRLGRTEDSLEVGGGP